MSDIIDIVKEISEPENDSEINRKKLEGKNASKRSIPISETKSKSDSTGLGENKIQGPISFEDALAQQQKVKSLLNKFDQIDSTIDRVSNTLENQSKKFEFSIDISNMPQVKKAVKKIFKKNINHIDKEMYLYAIKRLNEIQESLVDKEFDKIK